MKISGKHAVAEAIASGRTIDRLVVQKGLKDGISQRIIDDAKSRGILIRFMDEAALTREAASDRHQGFVAELTDFSYCTLEDIFAYAASLNQPPFIVLLDGVEDPHNLGSILRVAECAGVHGVVIPNRRSVSVNDTVVRVSAGAAAHVKVAKVPSLNDAIRTLKERNVFVFAAEANGAPIYQTNLKGAVALVIGGEDSGVKRLTQQLCDGVVALPMYGKVNSLNASVACGVVLYEVLRQRREAL
ncbi:MAG: 23S rRNA (guanosine(2251)-2'-O)-methyltransferase RlmB [Clostridiales bacterium]|jgi:23S rRNA (guanosine2251-2'-O)-methyltransferase|nr:23S rRNA (guanosine(2251)-2'-O)-methyltransferase RlmB [Clostridiales bacterium]